MKFLLDTSIFVSTLDSFQGLSKRAQEIFTSGEEIYLSSASSWEIVIKYGIGKLNLPKPPLELITETLAKNTIRPLPISLAHTLNVAGLPNHHKDPFDRILIAQAQHEKMILMTEDPDIAKYPLEILWCR